MASNNADFKAVEWRCFYCDEVFTSQELAQEHFGDYSGCECDTPACKLTAEEGPLISYIRRLRHELSLYYMEEDLVTRSIEIMKSDHRQALIRAEEKGYNKGVQDMKEQGMCPEPALHNPNTSTRNDVILKAIEWHKFQSAENANNLYNACDRLVGSKFDPREYDDVE